MEPTTPRLSRRIPEVWSAEYSPAAFEVTSRAGEESDVVDRAGVVELAAEPDRLAGLRGLGLRQLLAHRLELGSEAEQDPRALRGSGS